MIETSLRLLCAFEIGSDSDSKLRLNLGDAVLIYLKLLLKVEFGLTSVFSILHVAKSSFGLPLPIKSR